MKAIGTERLFGSAMLWSLRRPYTQKGDLVYSSLSIDRAPAIRTLGFSRVAALFSFALVVALAASASADEIASQFLAELRERGWHDVALEYLDNAADDPRADREFLQRVDYEKAVTLTEMAQKSLREAERVRYYDQAIELLRDFAVKNRGSLLYFDAMSTAAKKLGEQALGKIAAADRLPQGSDQQRRLLLSESRQKMEEAATVLEELLEVCREKLAALPKGAMSHQDPSVPATRDKVQRVEAEARLLAAKLLFEKSKTYSATSAKYVDTLEAAADAFTELESDYRESLAGYLGKLYQGRCYQELMRWDDALECYQELVEEPLTQPEFRRLKARAYRHRAECLLAQDELDQVIEECNECLRDAKGTETTQPEWLAVAYRLAEALERKSSQMRGGEANRLETEARQLFREVASQPGEFQTVAKAALASSSSAEPSDHADVDSFEDAYAAGKEALERMNASRQIARLAANNNPEAAPDLRRQAEENKIVAQELLRKSIRLADRRTKAEELLSAQYYLCWLYLEEERYAEAAILGSYLARKYPESSYAASGAKAALVAYEKLYRQARENGNDEYEEEQLASMAEFMSRRWPDSAEATASVTLLMQIALGEDRVADAKQLMQRLPKDNRAGAQLILGSSLWNSFLRQTRGSAEIGDAAEQLRQEASRLLRQGYQGIQGKGVPSYQEAVAVLHYVQLLLSQGDARGAIKVLERRQIGPLAVVDQKMLEVPAAFVQETHKAALRTYISASPPERQKAQRMMTALEQSVGSGPQAAERLNRVYLGIGLELQRQIEALTAVGKKQDAEQVAAAFEDLVERIVERGGTEDWNTRSWLAQSNLQLGEGLSGEAAERYLDEASQVLRAMLEQAANDPGYAPSPTAVLKVRKQLGDCLSARKEYAAAMEQYSGILKVKPNLLDLQKAIATMLQQWGISEQRPEKLEAAIQGALPQADKKNLVWGWLRLASIANRQRQSSPPDSPQAVRFKDLFFEARYNVARSQLYAAMVSTGAKKTEYLNAARKNVERMKRLYPGMGGPEWQQKFEELSQEIEAEGGA